MTTQMIAAICLMAWLIWETLWDFRDQNLPVWFSLVPLIGGLIYRVALGDWPAALFVALVVASTNLSNPAWRLPALGVLGAVALVDLPAAWLPLIAGVALSDLLFELGVMGGADALAVIYVLTWFPSWQALAAMLAGTLIVATALLVARHGWRAPLQFVNALRGKSAPTEAPGIAGFALGLAGFIVYRALPLVH